MILDLESQVDLLQGQASSLDVEVPNERDPGQVESSRNDIEAPPDAVNSCRMVS